MGNRRARYLPHSLQRGRSQRIAVSGAGASAPALKRVPKRATSRADSPARSTGPFANHAPRGRNTLSPAGPAPFRLQWRALRRKFPKREVGTAVTLNLDDNSYPCYRESFLPVCRRQYARAGRAGGRSEGHGFGAEPSRTGIPRSTRRAPRVELRRFIPAKKTSPGALPFALPHPREVLPLSRITGRRPLSVLPRPCFLASLHLCLASVRFIFASASLHRAEQSLDLRHTQLIENKGSHPCKGGTSRCIG